MILLTFLALAHAADVTGYATWIYTAGGIEDQDSWSTAILKKVATIGATAGSSGASYSLHCGSPGKIRTCAVQNAQGTEVARTTRISIDSSKKGTLTFADAPAATFPYTKVVVQ